MQASKQLGTVICRTSSAVRSRIVASTVTAPKFSVSQIRFFKSTPKSMTKVTQNSWAVERLEELGEKLEPGDVIPPTELSDEILYNPSPKVLKLADELLACNMVESNQVWRTIQTRLGHSMEELFSGSGNGGGGGGGGAAEEAPEPVKEKEAFDLKLTEVPAASKIKAIKEVRAITGLGLKEAKEMVEGAPVVVKQGLKKDEAEKLMKALVDIGAKAELL